MQPNHENHEKSRKKFLIFSKAEILNNFQCLSRTPWYDSYLVRINHFYMSILPDLSFRFEPAFCIDRGPAAHTGSGYRLTVNPVGTVAGGKNTVHIGIA